MDSVIRPESTSNVITEYKKAVVVASVGCQTEGLPYNWTLRSLKEVNQLERMEYHNRSEIVISSEEDGFNNSCPVNQECGIVEPSELVLGTIKAVKIPLHRFRIHNSEETRCTSTPLPEVNATQRLEVAEASLKIRDNWEECHCDSSALIVSMRSVIIEVPAQSVTIPPRGARRPRDYLILHARTLRKPITSILNGLFSPESSL